MIDLKDIQSLTEFQRNTRKSIARLKRTGRPAVLTVNGEAEVVVQDAKAYQRLLTRAAEAERLTELKHSISEYRSGMAREMDEALSELEKRHIGPAKRKRARTAR